MQGINLPRPSRITSSARPLRTGCPLRLLAVPLGVALALAASGGARAQDAEPNPYYIGLSEAITHNTNINNTTVGVGDTYLSTGVIGGFDQNIGRQRVYGSANVYLNRYREFSQLNNTSYGVNAGWDWQTIDRLSGTVNASVNQGLASLQNNLLQTSPGSNLVRTEQIGTRASWGGNAAIVVQGGYGYSRTSYSSPTLQAGDSNNSSTDIGVYYQPGATLTLGTALRFTRSNAERAYLLSDGSYLANRTNGRNIDLSANWRPTVQSGATARVSFTKQTDSTGGPGFSGLTGALGFSYMPTGKLSFNGQYSRDAATNGNFYNTFTGTTNQPTVGLASNNSVSDSLAFGVGYSATAKITASANLGYRRTTQDSAPGAVDNSYRDALTSFGIGVNWAILRNWSAACNVSRIQRRISGNISGDYNGNTYTCSTQVTLR